MGNYDGPQRTVYSFVDLDVANADGTDIERIIAVPLNGKSTAEPGTGRRGTVAGVLVSNISEAYITNIDAGGVQVGDGTTAGLYYDSGEVITEALGTVGASLYLVDSGSGVSIPAGQTSFTVTFNVPDDSDANTGISDYSIMIDWE